MGTFQYDEWFKASVTKNSAVFLGGGIQNQFLVQVDKYHNENIEYPFGFVIKERKAIKTKFIKYITEGDDENWDI